MFTEIRKIHHWGSRPTLRVKEHKEISRFYRVFIFMITGGIHRLLLF
jgi:hypothetical protein